MRKPMLILIAGPYRSGTGDDPDLIAANWHVWKRPRGRSSTGADQDVAIARERGLPVFFALDEISAREVNQ